MLSGSAASVVLATGRVRVATAESVNDLQPGEVLVAGSIDVGWTPFFSYTAAIIVDSGAIMSHAAIVAREVQHPVRRQITLRHSGIAHRAHRPG